MFEEATPAELALIAAQLMATDHIRGEIFILRCESEAERGSVMEPHWDWMTQDDALIQAATLCRLARNRIGDHNAAE